ncbi:MAG TPA: hypothetical protein VFG54_21195 [Prolixibacteraceae bacterium]|nr:hypothetical protein [Prolixibacteraceae bacterium]
MKTNLKITKKSVTPLKVDGDIIKAPKLQKDKSTKRKLSIYDDFSDENPDDFLNIYDDEEEDYK